MNKCTGRVAVARPNGCGFTKQQDGAGMSRDWRGWLVALAWLVPGAAAAQTLPGWEIGPEAYYYAYREPNLMHQIGPAVGYDRLSQYFYIPVGLGFSFVAGNWILRPTAEYDYLVRGKQVSYLSQDGANGDLTNKQTHGYGLRGTLLAETGTPWGRIAFGPFVRYWNIGESKPAFVTFAGVPVEGFEPHNKTLEAGATLRFRF